MVRHHSNGKLAVDTKCCRGTFNNEFLQKYIRWLRKNTPQFCLTFSNIGFVSYNENICRFCMGWSEICSLNLSFSSLSASLLGWRLSTIGFDSSFRRRNNFERVSAKSEPLCGVPRKRKPQTLSEIDLYCGCVVPLRYACV